METMKRIMVLVVAGLAAVPVGLRAQSVPAGLSSDPTGLPGDTGDSYFSKLDAAGRQFVREAKAFETALETSVRRTKPFPHVPGYLNLRVGMQRPAGKIIGDILYLHGFADCLANHGPLFDAFTQAGFRVISFDLPSHGESRGSVENDGPNPGLPSAQNNLSLYSFEKLASLALQVERETREDEHRPLILAGWSTGGLLAVRMVQKNFLLSGDRSPSGLILFAPGVVVHPFVGRFGVVTEETLTSNPDPPHKCPIKLGLRSPVLSFPFPVGLLKNAWASRKDPLPPNLPTVVFVGGSDEDRYADSPKLMRWVLDQRSVGAKIIGVKCPHAYHELDNEPDPIGREVRSAAASFAESAAGQPFRVARDILNTCRQF